MSRSPEIVVKEKDVSFSVQDVSSNSVGYGGLARWGEVNVPVIMSTETDIVARCGRPNKDTTLFFHAIKNYLLYSSPVVFVRAATKGMKNAFFAPDVKTGVGDQATTTKLEAVAVKNDAAFETMTLTNYPLMAKYPGAIANGIVVSICGPEDFSTWEYAKQFTYAPNAGSMHLIVIDGTGAISGEAGTVLEKYDQLSFVSGTRKDDGSSAYIVKVLSDSSSYLRVPDPELLASLLVAAPKSYASWTLNGGVDDNVVENADFDAVLDVLGNKELVSIGRIMTAGWPTVSALNAVTTAQNRQDAITFVAPPLDAVLNNPNARSKVIDYFSTTFNINTSYAFQVDNWKLVHDKYNDINIWLPCDVDAAGLHGRTYANQAPWYSPAGMQRGVIQNCIKLAWYPSKTDRDELYPKNINSIVSFPAKGVVLYGDKTALKSTSSFSAVNVRSLFIVMEQNIASDAISVQFEINDKYTRALFKQRIERYLETVKAGRGVYDYLVVCDETNNTSQVIENAEIHAAVYVKPSRTASTVELTFINTNSGTDFSEILGV